MNRPPSQRGSAIMLLFVAVALFGAVTYAFTRGSGHSVSMMTDEQAKVYAQQIIGYGNDLKTAVKRLQLRGCKENQISFSNTVYKNPTTGALNFPEGHNPNSPLDGSCDIFKTSGASLAPRNFKSAAFDDGTVGIWSLGDSGPVIVIIENVKTSAPELVIYMDKINEAVCRKINELVLGSAILPVDDFGAWVPYNGSHTNFPALTYGHVGDTESSIAGKTAFCVKSQSSQKRGVFHQVLIAR